MSTITESENELIKGMPDIFFAVDANWTVIAANPGFYQTTRTEPSTQIGANFLDLYLSHQGARESNYWILYHIAMKERVSLCFEDFHEPSAYWTMVTVHPRKDGGLNMYVRDHTAKKLKDSNESKLKDFFIQAPVPMCILEGPEHRFTLANPHYELFAGRKVAGKTLREAFPGGEADPYIPILDRVFKTGESFIGKEMPVDLPDEAGVMQRYWIDLGYHAFRSSNGIIKGIMAILLDVTESVNSRKKVEETIKELQAERDIREGFVAALSHDLRTPLTAAKLNSEVLARKLSGNPEMYKAAHRISENMNRADGMIRDILDVGLIKAGQGIQLNIEQCSINEIIKEVLEDMSGIHGDRFKVSANEEIDGFWGSSGLKRVMENLLTNAIKYGEKGAIVKVSTKKVKDKVLLDVQNRGNPIPPSDIPHLFDRFKRTNSALASGHKGWGLGLTLVQGITQSHGGKVSVISDAIEGTVFTIELPIDSR